MNHFTISLLKSLLRVIACALSFIFQSITILVVGLALAECLGVLEEMVTENYVSPEAEDDWDDNENDGRFF